MTLAQSPALPDHLAVSVEAVGKSFRPRLRVAKRDRRQRLRTLLSLLGLGGGPEGAAKVVLDGVNAQFRRGAVTGLIGESGCGKSVLLKLIAGVTPPSAGTIRLRGRVAKLLDPEDLNDNLTASDVLAEDGIGVPRGRPGAGQAAMLEFAGLADFADVPVRKYSTGMRQRLAMASVLCREAEVVLIDDYTRVGDLEFQEKCRERMRALAARGVAVIVASKDTGLLDGLCDDMVWMQSGTVVAVGEPGQVVARMLADSARRRGRAEATDLAGPLDGPELRLLTASVRDARTGEATGFHRLTSLCFKLVMETSQATERLRIALTLFNGGKQVLRTVLREHLACGEAERLEVSVLLPGGTLATGMHEVELVVEPVGAGEPRFLKQRPLLRFQVGADVSDPVPLPLFCRAGDRVVAAPDWAWDCTPMDCTPAA